MTNDKEQGLTATPLPAIKLQDDLALRVGHLAINPEIIGYVERQREWVGLTKEEVELWELPASPTVYEFALFVEAKLKEKNT
jgi:hypothetical protein